MTNLLDGKPAAVSYRQGAQPTRIFVFAVGEDGHMYLRYHNGAMWENWRDLDTPDGTTVTADHDGTGAITFAHNPDAQMVFNFARATNGNLVFVYSMDGGQTWDWADQGKPSATQLTGAPAVVTFRPDPQPQRAYVFVRGLNGHLYTNWWDGVVWRWDDLGPPDNTTVSASPGAVTYQDGAGPRHIHVFVRGGDGHLHLQHWNGSQWAWSDRGVPDSTTVSDKVSQSGDERIPRVTTYRVGAEPRRIHAFVTTQDSYVAVNYWDGAGWNWRKWDNLISPPGYVKLEPVLGQAITAPLDVGSGQRLDAFWVNWGSTDIGGENILCYHHWNGAKWTVETTGKVAKHTPTVITFKEGASPRKIHAFHCIGGKLTEISFDGNNWTSTSHGSP